MIATSSTPQTVICLKWGNRYGSEYVDKLHSMAVRNTKRPLRFVCITDDPTGIDEGIEIKPMPEFDLPETFRFKGFRRMFLFKETLLDLTGPVLHFDVDLLITGSIDDFFDYKPESPYIVAENWTQPGQGIGNMSVFRYNIGSQTKIWNRFRADPLGMLKEYNNSQTFCSRTLGTFDMFPLEWCIGFKQSLIPAWPLGYFVPPAPPPPSAKIVAFTGKPDQDETLDGQWREPKWRKRFYKQIPPAQWIADVWK